MTNPAPAWLLLGPETGEKNDFAASIKNNITAIYGAPPDEYSFYPYDKDASDIIALHQRLFSSKTTTTSKKKTHPL